jgi:hypothetical protein
MTIYLSLETIAAITAGALLTLKLSGNKFSWFWVIAAFTAVYFL